MAVLEDLVMRTKVGRTNVEMALKLQHTFMEMEKWLFSFSTSL